MQIDVRTESLPTRITDYPVSGEKGTKIGEGTFANVYRGKRASATANDWLNGLFRSGEGDGEEG